MTPRAQCARGVISPLPRDSLAKAISFEARGAGPRGALLGVGPQPFGKMTAGTMEGTLTLTLPDGSHRNVSFGTLPVDVVKSIGERLARDAVAVEVNGKIQDLVTPMRESGPFRVLTAKDPRALDVLRHSAAHILATAVRRLRPGAKIGFGASIEDRFYYDLEVE